MPLRFSSNRAKCSEIGLYLPDHVSLSETGIFQFRFVFPIQLRNWLGRRELKISLGRDYCVALQQAWRYNKFVQILKRGWQRSEAVFDVTDEERREIAAELVRNMLWGDSTGDPFMMEWMSQQSVQRTSQTFLDIFKTLTEEASPEQLRKCGITPAKLTQMQQQLENHSQAAPVKTLAAAVDDWIVEKARAGRGDKSMGAYKMVKQELCWAFGTNTDIASLTFEQIDKYKTFWQCAVPDLEYRREHKLTVQKVIDGKYQPPETYLADKTKANKHRHLGNFLKWCFAKRYTPEDFSVVWRGGDMGFKIKRKAKSSLPDDIIKALYLEVMRYKNNGAKNTRGDLRYRYWVLLLLLYTGARLGEICQLRCEDVLMPGSKDPIDLLRREVHCPCICIQGGDGDGGKLLVKNESSERTVPLHRVVLRAGFLNYVQSRKAAGKEKLFDVSYTKANGWGGKIGEYFNEIIRKKFPDSIARIGSTRHNVETQYNRLLTIGSPEYKIALQLMGRSYKEDNMVRQAYLDLFPTEDTQPIIEKISYPCVEEYIK